MSKNGKKYNYKDVKFFINGVEIKGITHIKYTPSIVHVDIGIECIRYLESDHNQN